MTDVESLTVEILREIRDGVRGTNEKIDQTNAHLDQTNAGLDKVEEVLRDLAGQFVILGRFVKNV